jgi:hypothetical protein
MFQRAVVLNNTGWVLDRCDVVSSSNELKYSWKSPHRLTGREPQGNNAAMHIQASAKVPGNEDVEMLRHIDCSGMLVPLKKKKGPCKTAGLV